MCPGRSAARSAALRTRDRCEHRFWNGPGSAVHHSRCTLALHRVRDTRPKITAPPEGGAACIGEKGSARDEAWPHCTSWITLPSLALPCARYWPMFLSSAESDTV